MAGRCAKHPGNHLLYRCRDCGKQLCSDCVITRELGLTSRITCPTCDAPAEPLGAGEVPLTVAAIEIIKEPFSNKHGIFAIVLSAAFCTVLHYLAIFNILFILNFLAYAIMSGIYASFVASTLKSSSEGNLKVPIGIDFTDIYSDLVRPAFLLLCAFAATWSPLIAYMIIKLIANDYSIASLLDFTAPEKLILSVLILYGLVCNPMGVAVTLYSGSFTAGLNPKLLVQMVLVIPKGYLTTIGLLYSSALAVAIVELSISLLFTLIGVPAVINHLLAWTLRFYGGYVWAALLGNMLFAHSDKFGIRAGGVDTTYQATEPPLATEPPISAQSLTPVGSVSDLEAPGHQPPEINKPIPVPPELLLKPLEDQGSTDSEDFNPDPIDSDMMKPVPVNPVPAPAPAPEDLLAEPPSPAFPSVRIDKGELIELPPPLKLKEWDERPEGETPRLNLREIALRRVSERGLEAMMYGSGDIELSADQLKFIAPGLIDTVDPVKTAENFSSGEVPDSPALVFAVIKPKVHGVKFDMVPGFIVDASKLRYESLMSRTFPSDRRNFIALTKIVLRLFPDARYLPGPGPVGENNLPVYTDMDEYIRHIEAFVHGAPLTPA